MMNNPVKHILAAVVLLLALAGPALAGPCDGQYLAGQICGNAGSSQALPGPGLLSPLIDRNFGAPSAQGTVLNRGSSLWSSTIAPVLGNPGTTTGSLGLASASGGTATIQPPAIAGNTTLQLPSTGGTIPSSATTPITLDATTGIISCPSCATTSSAAANDIAYYTGTRALGGVALSGIVIASTTAVPSAYSGTSCTNQVMTALSANGVGTCNSITNAYLTAGSFTNITGVGTLTVGTWTASILGMAYGGTNANLAADPGAILYSTGSAIALLAHTATANLPLCSGAAAAPTWCPVIYPTTLSSGGVLYGQGASVIASSGTLSANQLILGGGAGAAPTTVGSLGTTTTVLHGNAAGAPNFASVVTADIAANAATNAKLAAGAANTIKGSIDGVTVVDLTASTWFDAAYCNSAGYIIARLVGTWTCSRAIPINVKWLGALGDGSTDDTTAINNAYTAAAASNSDVYFPDGIYCVKTGPVGPTSGNIRSRGSNWLSAELSACGANVAVFQMGGGRHVVENLAIYGLLSSSASGTAYALHTLTTCVDCVLHHVYITGGWFAVFNEGVDTLIDNIFVSQVYGNAVVQDAANAMWMRRSKIDQVWPVSLPTNPLTISAWTATTAYTAGTSVINVNGFAFQCSRSGTSGSTFPAAPYIYNVAITDGTAQWQLVAPYPTYYGLRIDGGASETHIQQSDFSGSYISASIGINTNNGGAAPFLTIITDSVISQSWGSGIDAISGNNLILTGNELGGCLQAGCDSVSVRSAWTGDVGIANNTIFSSPAGVYIGAGVNSSIIGNRIGASSTGIIIEANQNYFNVIGNTPSTKFGGNCNVTVTTGTSNHYNIVNQIGCTITDNGSGVNKTVSQNN